VDVVRCPGVSAAPQRPPSPMTALECVNVCFIASYMHSTGPEDLPLDTRLCCRFWAMSLASTLGVQVHALSFDRGFVQHDVVDDETKTERIIQARDQVEKFRVVYAPFVQSGDVRSASGDCCNDSSPCRSRFFPWKQKRRVPRRAYLVRGTLLLLLPSAPPL